MTCFWFLNHTLDRVSTRNVIITSIIIYVQKLLSLAFFFFSSGGYYVTRGSVKVEISSFLLVSIDFTVALMLCLITLQTHPMISHKHHRPHQLAALYIFQAKTKTQQSRWYTDGLLAKALSVKPSVTAPGGWKEPLAVLFGAHLSVDTSAFSRMCGVSCTISEKEQAKWVQLNSLHV